MPSCERLEGALDALFVELGETVSWEREIAGEARRAAVRRERLAFSLRATIDALDVADRGTHLARLRALLGALEPPRHLRRPTERTRIAQGWLANRDPAEFHIAELRLHFEAMGHKLQRGYLPTLLARWSRAGLVARIDHGRYRINRDHPELAGRGRTS